MFLASIRISLLSAHFRLSVCLPVCSA